MPKTAQHGRWATCVQHVYSQWFDLSKSARFIHSSELSSMAVGKYPDLYPPPYTALPMTNAHLFYSISSVVSDLSTLYTELTITTTTYIKYRSIGI
jgi:hypothetical protein